jgi:hypothetical protein
VQLLGAGCWRNVIEDGEGVGVELHSGGGEVLVEMVKVGCGGYQQGVGVVRQEPYQLSTLECEFLDDSADAASPATALGWGCDDVRSNAFAAKLDGDRVRFVPLVEDHQDRIDAFTVPVNNGERGHIAKM